MIAFASNPTPAAAAAAKGSVPAVEKVFFILETLAASESGLTLGELARVCALPKSSVYCILLTLQRRGYLDRSEQSCRYFFSRKFLFLANESLCSVALRESAEPLMESLSRRTGRKVELAALEGYDGVLVAVEENHRDNPGASHAIGHRFELHCSATGKALIAHWDDQQVAALVLQRGLPRHNDNTIASTRRLIDELARVRRLGYSTDDEEHVLGRRSIGAPVLDPYGRTIAAVGITGSVSEITAENAQPIAELLRRTAAELSRSLTDRNSISRSRAC